MTASDQPARAEGPEGGTAEDDAPLSERLMALSRDICGEYPEYATVMDQLFARTKDAGSSAPKVGEPMPHFILPDERGRLTSLEELLDRGPVAVAFHRGHWCPFCRMNMIALAKAHREEDAVRGHLVAITPERWRYSSLLKRETGADFPVLTDMDNSYALLLNIAFWLGRDMGEYMANAGIDVSSYQGNAAWLLPIPATFVIGTDGFVVSRFIDPDYRKRMSIETLVAALTKAP